MAVERRAWTVAEIAEMYGLSRKFIYKLVEDGKLRRIPNTGRRILISDGECRRYFDDHEMVGAA